jgi:hypothetical protein
LRGDTLCEPGNWREASGRPDSDNARKEWLFPERITETKLLRMWLGRFDYDQQTYCANVGHAELGHMAARHGAGVVRWVDVVAPRWAPKL